MHKENINGILADEMGLGKTCQTISFLTHLLETSPKLTHLIIVPPSTLDNWVREISTWSPSLYFTVYQGNLEERRELRFNILNNKFEKHLNCILTTYGLISSTNEDKAFFKKLKLEYCVFDEAHMLKNMNSIRYQSLIQIKSKRKLLLTGTPLQNNIVELMSLLYFVMPDIFHHKTQYLNKIFASKPVSYKETLYVIIL
jgi:SWI/SNF-related matrix-associated actin-dependent regulator 1 of chromatin subfamily A